MYLPCSIAGVKVNCLIDTGANTSIIHPKKYYSIPESARSKLQTVTRSIRLADGGKIQPLGEVILPLFIPDVGTLYQNFLVAETNEPLVLGYDFFHKHQCVIDLTNNTLQIEGKTVDCCLESKLLSLFRIKLTETITIPSNSEMIVGGYFNNPDKDILPKCPLLEGSDKLLENKQVMVARSLVNLTLLLPCLSTSSRHQSVLQGTMSVDQGSTAIIYISSFPSVYCYTFSLVYQY